MELIAALRLAQAVNSLLGHKLLGCDWKHEPGGVWLGDAVFLKGLKPIKVYRYFEYTHWRERSLWRGKVYKNEANLC